MSPTSKEQNLWAGLLLLLVLLGLTFWVYGQIFVNYQSLERSNQIVQSLLESQASQVKEYSQEIALIKEALERTETLTGQYKKENEKLRDKIKLLDKVEGLENSITRLKEKNARIINRISQIDLQKTPVKMDKEKVSTVQEGLDLLAKYREKMKVVKVKIHEIKKSDHKSRIIARDQMDEVKLMAGNNGFLIRDGQKTSAEFDYFPKNRNIKIDVTFMK
ncbi:MAG: hypothetical protein KAR05_09230 [Candidatus Omnitrophica bacterium]|nr:hypothetical protein [Candidatus Omnitrophota bacterium]MCK5590643.1 hypothetical protein [Candidatus Paceibacterota bacterium]